MNTLSRRSFLASGTLAVSGGLRPPLARSAEDAAKFKLGIVTYNVPKDWDLPTLLKVCKEVGIAAVECRTTHKHGVEPTLTADQRKDVKKQFADAGVVFWGCGTVCEFHSDNPAVVKKNVEDCKEFVKLVQDIGGNGVKVRPNGVPKGVDEEKTFEQIGKALDECGQGRRGRGRRDLGRGPRRGHAAPEEHEDHHGGVRPQVRRRDVELEPDRRGERLGRRQRSNCSSRGSSRATSTTWKTTRRASTRTASCSNCSAASATTATRCARWAKPTTWWKAPRSSRAIRRSGTSW